jgi:glycosyltransferase involved in cell wall biosynthesis
MHLLAPADAGGLERVVHALAIGQQRRGHHVVAVPVAEAWSADHSFGVPLARAGIEVRPLVQAGRAYAQERASLATLLRQTTPDVVHTHGYHTDVVGAGVARRLGIPTVSTAHGFTRGGLRNRAYEYINRRALRSFDAVVAVSQPLGDELVQSGVPRERVHVIPNAWSRISASLERVAARKQLGLNQDAFIVGWVGRMSHEKGLDVFVDALASLNDVPIWACAVGDGPERAPQQRRAEMSGTDERIRWTGLVREAGRCFPAFDALVLSSRTEGVPMVVLEAMATQVPLVVTAVGGIPDVLSPREALLVPSERPDLLASAIRCVFQDRHGALDRAAAAAVRVEREFAEGPWLDRYEAVYAAAASRRRNR